MAEPTARELRSMLGSVLHALIADPAKTESQLVSELERPGNNLRSIRHGSPTTSSAGIAPCSRRSSTGGRPTRYELTEVGIEVEVDGVVAAPDGEAPGVRLRGRVDRLERDAEGRLVIVDVKTGKTPVSKDDAQQHAQLAFYQLAVAEGMCPPRRRARRRPAGLRRQDRVPPVPPNASRIRADRRQPRRMAAAGAATRPRRPPARNSSREATTAARTARCGRLPRPQRATNGCRHDATTPPN